ncbi:MOSC domain-containing protein [Persicimonas caeni]|uniref:MOSC domain-containing protein n=1 Tax=Persicimonas caeni TaxID=2292766 RepID=A0A4Y6PNG7_PERCE|nr:MOSC domain-containing protein [Persicimonas caeni]QDG49355.1 MOSC domain-containing protein [Persicimonas caeni]QED30576.1 MOSC domain-containing protein [Persicimonas caeni]
MNDIVISSLHIYPVKSAAGVEVDAARVTDRGFAHDRRWMVVAPDGTFITQRSHPKLALVRPSLGGGELRLERAGAAPLVVPAELGRGAELEVEVWGERCKALDAGDEAGRWFGEELGTDCRLVFMPESTRRAVDPKHGGADDIVSFADGYPFLLIEQASLEDLNGRLDAPVPMDRFRPNIVVDGAEAFAADDWERVRIGKVEFRVAKPCDRCVVTTIDQATGEKGKEPLRTLATYRREGSKVLFGQNLIQQNEGVVRVGDRLEVLE